MGNPIRENLKSDHFKSKNIQNLDFLKILFQMILVSKGQATAMVLTI